MRAYFEDGTVIVTDSAPMPLRDEIIDKQSQLEKIQMQIKRLTRVGASKDDRRLAQAMQSDYDTLLAETKKLVARYQAQF